MENRENDDGVNADDEENAIGKATGENPANFGPLSKAQMLSPTGRCHTFDADADGYVRGEGAGVLLLKRLSDAERDGDRIIAIIRGSAVNQDGRSSSLTAPNGPSQQAVIRAALQSAGVEAQDVDWVETHGTGTPLGDPIEVQSLAAVYGAARGKENPLTISAVKTNIGHLESAAAVSSGIKAALSLKHEQIPAHLHFRKFNPHMAVDAAQFTITTQLTPFARGERKSLVGVRSYGLSGNPLFADNGRGSSEGERTFSATRISIGMKS